MNGSSLWKILLAVGIVFTFVAFILGWIGFGVPDWQGLQRYNGSIVEYYGLWAYCQNQATSSGSVCQRWPTAANQLFNGTQPTFISTADGLITTGMILLSIGLIVAIVATILPLLAYAAAALAFLAFLFLVIGLPIFGRESNNLSSTRGDYSYYKRYGFWLIVPTIVLEFLATLLFLAAAILYKSRGYGNIATSSGKRPYNNLSYPLYGGSRALAPFNMINQQRPMNLPYGMRPPLLPGMGAMPYAPVAYPTSYPRAEPSLLSQYLTQRVTPSYDRPLPPITVPVLPQPSAVRATAAAPLNNVTPDYYRIGEPAGPPFRPIINLTGQTIVGPLMRTA